MPASDYHWKYDDEPHASRRQQIMAKYGDQLRPLMGPEWRTAPIVVALVAAQLYFGVAFQHLAWVPWLAACWVIGGTINHALFLAVHEITHNLAFKSTAANKILAFIANIPIGIPYAATFHGYHAEHHKYQGHDGIDTDIPTEFEARIIQGKVTKALFCFFQILFYALRPCLTRSQRIGSWHVANWLLVPFVLYQYITAVGMAPYFYLLMSTFCAGAWHPVSGHFLSEHFVFDERAETYSYYGPLNVLAFNVGYHNEHHDFPFIPWSRLPQVRKIAPEFYDDLPQTKSWPGTIWDFIMTEKMSGFSRVKRGKRDRSVRRE
eukprot:TRINITY_DN9080_c0_g1_i1.p1 TRINITY_DN9080_c0_g1~~TRINITY_DN9080_c0_g1_i1.p1  ORF type:complete len:320 (+),score=87.73 TRINITY_DN9080_c0_g1_i1:72-1031(+)